MITQATLNFFKQIEENNNKPWFEINRPLYEAAKANYLDLSKFYYPKSEILTKLLIKTSKNKPVEFIGMFDFPRIKALTKTILVR